MPKKVDDRHREALEEFKLCEEAEQENREAARDDLKFTFLDEQWPSDVQKQRELDSRPCLTINKTKQFVKQVVNNGRRNKPAIKVQPVDSDADPETAEIISGLIRNIEYTSQADIAYDTGFEFAVAGGFGYWRVNMDYAHDDTFDMDIKIDRISNCMSVYGDYRSKSATSDDWNVAFIVDTITKDEFERKYKNAEKVDWSMGAYAELPAEWMDDDRIIIAERWKRSEVERKIARLSDGKIVDQSWLEMSAGHPEFPQITHEQVLNSEGTTVVNQRTTKSWKVTQDIMTGAEILETNDWPGKFIPIVPVYGEEINIEGKRHFRSLIRSGKDAQRMFNFWRTCSTELVALAPKAPFIGPVGAFNTDSEKWATANTQSYPYIEFDPVPNAPGGGMPQRQPFSGVPAGPLQEALNASDDMKAIFGMYDASLGARSNETSGVAINQRKQQGDMSTYDFVDNQARAIGHTGRIIIDLIPYVYNNERIIRVLGQDTKPKNVQLGQKPQGMPPQMQQGEQEGPNHEAAEMGRVYDLTIGKYDLVVSTGPSFATQREEAAYQMTEFIRSVPASGPLLGDLLAKNQDWPDADEVEKRLKTMLPPQAQGQNPELQQMQQQMQQMDQQARQAIGQLQQQLEDEKRNKALEFEKLKIDAHKADTDRLKVQSASMTPEQIQMIAMQTFQQMMRSPDITPAQQPQVQPMPGMHQMPDGQMMPDNMMNQPQQPQNPM